MIREVFSMIDLQGMVNIYLSDLFLLQRIIKKTKPIMKQRKVLIGIAVAIFILLLLYWLFVAEDINAWLPVN